MGFWNGVHAMLPWLAWNLLCRTQASLSQVKICWPLPPYCGIKSRCHCSQQQGSILEIALIIFGDGLNVLDNGRGGRPSKVLLMISDLNSCKDKTKISFHQNPHHHTSKSYLTSISSLCKVQVTSTIKSSSYKKMSSIKHAFSLAWRIKGCFYLWKF